MTMHPNAPTRQHIICFSVLLAMATGLTLGRTSSARGNAYLTNGAAPVRLKLIAEYKENRLKELSPDGRLMALYHTSRPVLIYSSNPRGGPSSAPLNANDSILRVVGIEGGRELGRIRTELFPTVVHFIPGTRQIFYKEPNPARLKNGERLSFFKVWDYSTGVATTCGDIDAATYTLATFLSDRRAIVASYSLVMMTFPGCQQTLIGQADPEDPRFGPRTPLVVSPSGKYVAYAVGTRDLIVRDLATNRVIKQLHPPPGLFFNFNLAYTADGKFLVIPASDILSDKPQGKQVLLFYHAVSYELFRELDLRNTNTLANTDALKENHHDVGSGIYGIALSPDGRILAIGRRSKDETGAIIILLDIATGQQLTTASHPPIKPERNDPWRADINALVFTPDGKYLISSTYDTRVWEIDRPAS